jgi:thiamine-monophosphate kinase
MPMMEEISENQIIGQIAKNFPVSPFKINKIHEADAELINLGGGFEKYLALTTDALVEEVSSGLYEDPYFIGWMLATVNFSDLAAVGSEPLGILPAITYPPDRDESFLTQLARGISDACRELGTFVLGGDTNQGNQLFLSACAVGLVPKESTISRIGAKPGDKLYLTGPAGLGNIFAFLHFSKPESNLPKSFYQPLARIKEGKSIRRFGSCCMDSSDGVIHTVDTLMRLNHCQFVLNDDWDNILHPAALEVCRAFHLPAWLALAAVHGEFELCFTVSPRKEKNLQDEAAAAGWTPVLIGEVREGAGVAIQTSERLIAIDTTLIRNLSSTAGSDQQRYIGQLLEISRKAGI